MGKPKVILGIDPGLTGAFVTFDGQDFSYSLMPLTPDRRVDFDAVWDILELFATLRFRSGVFLERAMPMAMGAKHAFNYGRDFAAIEHGIQLAGVPVVQVEPSKWTKVVYQGVSADLKPKAKSLVALKRLLPKLYSKVPTAPKSGKLHEGVVDALLIAYYGYNLQK